MHLFFVTYLTNKINKKFESILGIYKLRYAIFTKTDIDNNFYHQEIYGFWYHCSTLKTILTIKEPHDETILLLCADFSAVFK